MADKPKGKSLTASERAAYMAAFDAACARIGQATWTHLETLLPGFCETTTGDFFRSVLVSLASRKAEFSALTRLLVIKGVFDEAELTTLILSELETEKTALEAALKAKM